jgi:hypothetical protein
MGSRKKPAVPQWLLRCAAPVRLAVVERAAAAGYADDMDGWVAGILTTAQLSPQGYVLRLPVGRAVVRTLSEQAEQAELFSREQGAGSREQESGAGDAVSEEVRS